MRRALFLALLPCALAVTGCSSSPRAGADSLLRLPVPKTVTIRTAAVPGLGRILVDGAGYALYMFPPDAGSQIRCTGACVGTWPPLVVHDAAAITAGAGVNASDLGTLGDPDVGAPVVTYAGYPLYRYAGDVAPGTANGQALFNDGGPWYVVDGGGQPVTADPHSADD